MQVYQIFCGQSGLPFKNRPDDLTRRGGCIRKQISSVKSIIQFFLVSSVMYTAGCRYVAIWRGTVTTYPLG